MRTRLCITIVLLLALGAAKPPAPKKEALVYRCRPTSDPIAINGKLDEPAWASCAWTSDFVDVASGDRAALQSRVRMLYDADYLYIAAEMEEPDVTGERTDHDDKLYLENAFEVFIDPDCDGRNYVEIEINPMNAILDLMMEKPYAQRGKAHLEWTCDGMKHGVYVAGTLNDSARPDKSWSIELAIPWTALKDLAPRAVPPVPGTKWKVELTRVHQGGKVGRALWAWAPTGQSNFHLPDKWGIVEFTK